MKAATCLALVAAPRGRREPWAEIARFAEDRGYVALVCPDTPATGDPTPYLAVAAAATRELRVGTWVTSTAWHEPPRIARAAAALADLSGGRFDLGLGTGRPADDAALREWGFPPVKAATRRDRIVEATRLVRDATPSARIVVAAVGPKSVEVAAAHADVVALALPPAASWSQAARRAADVHSAAARAGREVGLALNLVAVGDRVASWHGRAGLRGADLRAADAVALLPADPSAVAAGLQRLHRDLGVVRLCVPLELAEHVGAGPGSS